MSLVSNRVLTPDGVRPAQIDVTDGVITDVGPPMPGFGVLDVGDLVVLPGLVDSHVHVNEPGRTHWEGFATATRAAAAGGVTTIVDMPLNCLPPTIDVDALAVKQAAATPNLFVDVAFWGGAVPGSEHQLDELHRAGVRGFKAFLCDSGVPEYGCVHPRDVSGVLARVAELDSTLIVHAEDPDELERAAAKQTGNDPRRHQTWLDSRPDTAEVQAARAVVNACRRTGGRAHVLHLSSADAGDVLADARAEGLPITVETCPHYLTINAEEIADGATAFKCAPPIRGRANADRLWALLGAGAIDAVVSDHSPCPPEDKRLDSGDFMAAWGRIASLQLGLPLVWTEASRRGHDLPAVVGWMSTAPARIAGLAQKGEIAQGASADLVTFDPDAVWTIDGPSLQHRHPTTPHHGRTVRGRVHSTYLGGVQIVADGQPVGDPRGRLR